MAPLPFSSYNSSMRPGIVLALMTGLLVAGISGASVWRAKSLMERELGVLTAQLDGLEDSWEEKNTPSGSRFVTFLLSDARVSFDPFHLKRPEPEGILDRLRRSIVGGPAVSPAPTALVRGFSDSTQLVAWTHDGFKTIHEESMARELAKAILKAHDAGAEINIVASGSDMNVVLMALSRVEGQVRGGAKVGANKVFFVGAKIPARPANVVELANFWSTREIGSTIKLQMYGVGRNGEEMDLESFWPGLSSGADSIDKTVRLLQRSVESSESMNALIGAQHAFIQELRAKKAAAKAAEEAVLAAEQAKADAARKKRDEILARAAARNARKTTGAETTAASRPPDGRSTASAATGGTKGPWSTGRIHEYGTQKAVAVGWTFSAPAHHVKALEHGYTDMLDVAGQMSDRECMQFFSVAAVSTSKLGPGNRDEAIIELWWQVAGDREPLLGTMIDKKTIQGFPAIFYRTFKSGAGGTLSESSFQVVDIGKYLIYSRLQTTSTEEKRYDCLNYILGDWERFSGSVAPEGR